MGKTCASCGKSFKPKRATAKYCGDRCRQRAHRKPGGKMIALPAPAAPNAPEGDLSRATRRSLEDAERLGTELGAAAMLLARRLDAVGQMETGAGVAALMKEYRATLADALKDAEAADDELDQIRASAALVLLQGGRTA